ncbi:MAG: RNA methyltransferase [Bacteroidota bacterium]
MRKLENSELNRMNVEQFHESEKVPMVVVLDNIRSRHNIGSVFRTSDAFRLEKICLCGITATPPDREIQKSALDATLSVKWEYFPDAEIAIEKLKNAGYKIYLVEQTDDSIPVHEFIPDFGNGIVLVFGNEVNGVDEKLLQYADACVEIPQYGTKHSLNVSVSAGIMIWALFEKYRISRNFNNI